MHTPENIALHLAELRKKNLPIGKLNIADSGVAYRVQRELHRIYQETGRTLIGWKIAAATKAQQAALNLSAPALGAIFSDNLKSSGARIKAEDYIKLGIEAELAFRASPDIVNVRSEIHREQAESLISSFAPAFELIDNRFIDLAGASGADRISDDYLQAGCVLGEERVISTDTFAMCINGTLSHNDLVISGCRTEIELDAFDAFVSAVNILMGLGIYLQPGQILLTGSLHKPIFIESKGLYCARLGSIGGVEVNID